MFLDHLVRVATGAHAHQFLRGVKLASQGSQHIHSSQRFALQQNCNIVAINLDAGCFLKSSSRRLVAGSIQHGGEAEEFSLCRFVDHDFLIVVVDSRDPNRARDHDVGPASGIANLVNSLARSKLLDFDLAR